MLTVAEYEDLASTILDKYEYPFHRVVVRLSKKMKRGIAHVKISKKTITLSFDWFDCNGADFAVYILKHEIAHLKYPDHSPAFKRECLRMGIKSKAILKNKDIAKYGWHAPDGLKMDGIATRWAPRQYCRYEDCEELV